MLRYLYVLLANFYRMPWIVPRMRRAANHPEKYTEEERYTLAKELIEIVKHTGKIETVAVGWENLPKEGGYIMYPNHQGKYDVLGIVTTHPGPCSFVMDRFKSYTVIVREFVDLLHAKRLEKNNLRQGLSVINAVAEEVREGKRYVLFPEGGYRFNNQNRLGEFKAGSFKIAKKSKAPIVPVALIDSYKVFDSFSCRPVTTYVHYLQPIFYEEYAHMSTPELAALVRLRIGEKISEQLSGSIS